MGAGIPGTGMATLFYIISVFLMPLREIVAHVARTEQLGSLEAECPSSRHGLGDDSRGLRHLPLRG